MFLELKHAVRVGHKFVQLLTWFIHTARCQKKAREAFFLNETVQSRFLCNSVRHELI